MEIIQIRENETLHSHYYKFLNIMYFDYYLKRHFSIVNYIMYLIENL